MIHQVTQPSIYLFYSLMDSINSWIVHVEVIDKRETGGKSSVMEKLVLQRFLIQLQNRIKVVGMCDRCLFINNENDG